MSSVLTGKGLSSRRVLCAAVAAALFAGGAWMSAPTPDEVAVRAALEHYIQGDRKSTRLNSSHCTPSRMPSSA